MCLSVYDALDHPADGIPYHTRKYAGFLIEFQENRPSAVKLPK